MGSDCDDAGALALLHQYANQGKAEILACIYSSGKVPYGAGVIEAINIYYRRGDIPVGACQDNDFGDPVDKMNAEKLVSDTHNFGQEDSSVTYITVGHTKGLYEIMISGPDEFSSLNGHELLDRKLQRWVALGGLNANNNQHNEFSRDWNFFFNETAGYTDYLLENFPVPVYIINAGSKVMTGRSLKNTPENNIVRQAYNEWLGNFMNKNLDDQRPSWDLAAVYFAVEDTSRFLEYEEPGYLEFNPEKGSRWIESKEKSNHHYINQRPGTDSTFARYLNRMIALPPA